ncbi:MAG: hypothetical protein KAV00_03860 [Phycisphaerae bacterium]|nr:hypothetical protein [Phycisphaerae bacterium]
MATTNNTLDGDAEPMSGKAELLSNLVFLVEHSTLKWTQQNIDHVTVALDTIIGDAQEAVRAARDPDVDRVIPEKELGHGACIAQGRRAP